MLKGGSILLTRCYRKAHDKYSFVSYNGVVDTRGATDVSFPYEPREVGLQMRSKFLSSALTSCVPVICHWEFEQLLAPSVVENTNCM